MQTKSLVVYYSRTGNNRFTALRLAERLGCDSEELRSRSRGFFSLLMGSALGFGAGNLNLEKNPADYDRVILLGPIWMGKVVLPLRAFLRTYGRSVKALAFVTVCGSDEASKDGGFGYETVFGKFRAILGDKFAGGFAIPVTLLPESGANATETRLTAENFTGAIAARFEEVVGELKGAPK